MTISVDNRLSTAMRLAKEQVVVDLSDYAGQPIVAFCQELVDWVFCGRTKPCDTPTDRARGVVWNAVNSALYLAYGDKVSPSINPDIRVRRDAI